MSLADGALRQLVGPRARQLYRASIGRQVAARRQRPEHLRRIAREYQVADLVVDDDGRVPVRWWTHADNFGDLLSPWLVERMTGRRVVAAGRKQRHYVTIGSILGLANASSIVWGTGMFGTEDATRFAEEATYTAVRGPLSRVRLAKRGIDCPKVYGDPALLVPAYFSPRVAKTHKYGIVARWSDEQWRDAAVGPDVKLIDLGTSDVEGVIEAMLSCRYIVTGSLHGLVMADAYGIPSAWVITGTAEGGAFKFFDYFSTVNKFRNAQHFDFSRPVTAGRLRGSLDFDSRPIRFDHRRLLDACPFLHRVGSEVGETAAEERPVLANA
ncbi:MAG: polysaccharide pyruvyl transferase family protein [Marmoricola sp.]